MQLIEKNICIYGVIISTGYGVVTLQGFLIAFIGEVFRICYMGFNSNSFGLVVNLYQNDTMNLLIGALLLNPRNRLSEGAKVNGLCRLASIILGDFAIGSILDPVGNFILNSGRIDVQYRWVVESPAPGIIDRQSVFEPLQTGVISIDSMIPIGRGQRELIVGDRQTGKTSIGVDTILNQKYKKVKCWYKSRLISVSLIIILPTKVKTVLYRLEFMDLLWPISASACAISYQINVKIAQIYRQRSDSFIYFRGISRILVFY